MPIAVDADDDVYFSGTLGVPASIYVSKLGEGDVVSVGDGGVTGPAGLALGPNHPNPFKPATTISYLVPDGGPTRVRLNVYDAGGRLVRRLVDEPQSGGRHSVTWHGRDDHGADVTSGVYFYRLEWEGQRLAQRMVVVR